MARWTALLLLGALASVTTGAAAGCGYREWECDNGKCIEAWLKCSGVSQCSDGSDEDAAMCDQAPSMRIEVAQVTAVSAEYKKEYQAVEVHLCGMTSCNQIVLDGRTADGTLAYGAYTECNARGRSCKLHKMNYPNGWSTFPAGPLVFKVQRRSSKLAVWLDGLEDDVVTVPVKKGWDLLRVVPHQWTSDLPVQFDGMELVY